ncbi:hypothetical protein GGR42_001948 [Saonia flava]|uniref:DUF4837 domain-containing protein n=1 Tax=Saonia flava TaxID=523696 RepID=A0A846QR37_9FLAO|nr:DUF4837 family protein [Saonia flava]NJB71486.1 hypothetical protein [Saonia flava]
MKSLRTLLVLAITISFFLSCKNKNKTDYKPSSIGGINTLTVVMDNDLWNGPAGDKIREHFAAPLTGMIWDEPKFSINQIPKSVFSGAIRNSRSLIFADIDTVSISHVKTNLYARPQKIGVFKGRTLDELIANIENKANDAIAGFKELEIEEAQTRFKRSVSKEKVLEEKFGVSMTVPSIYKVGKQEDNFVWMDRQIPKGHMNIIVYSMPEDSFNTDSTFVKDIIKMRDSIGEKYVPGPDMPGKVTYMITEKAFAPAVFPAEIGGKKAAEVRGIWEVKNDFMAGPFLTYIINDEANKRKLVVEGFTFAPATEKRDYMFELEAILKTLKIG